MSISPLRKAVSQPTPQPPTDEERVEESVKFRFKEITPEDWRANEAPLADLFQRGLVSAEYVRQRLRIPEEGGVGTMVSAPSQTSKPFSSLNAEVPERWRLKHTKRGVIAERLR